MFFGAGRNHSPPAPALLEQCLHVRRMQLDCIGVSIVRDNPDVVAALVHVTANHPALAKLVLCSREY